MADTAGHRNALVTGASRGIGAAIARRLARDGFRVWLGYRSRHAAAEGVAKEIHDAGGAALLLPFDVGDPAAVRDVVEPAIAEHGTLSVLVNNAGLARDGLVPTLSDDDWDAVIQTNLSGPFRLTRLALKGMMRQRWGRVVNLASVSAQMGNPGQASYAAAKAGLVAFTRSVALEFGRRNVLVNAVAPGLIETEMIAEVPVDAMRERIALRRIGAPEEVAGVVSFLCSEDASYITGQLIAVNGGLYTGS